MGTRRTRPAMIRRTNPTRINQVAVVNKREPQDMGENAMSIFLQSSRSINCRNPSVVALPVASPFVIFLALRIPKRSHEKSSFAVVFIRYQRTSDCPALREWGQPWMIRINEIFHLNREPPPQGHGGIRPPSAVAVARRLGIPGVSSGPEPGRLSAVERVDPTLSLLEIQASVGCSDPI